MSWFILRRCSDIKQLEVSCFARYEQVIEASDEVKNWPKGIQDHKDEIARDGIKDSVIENFQISKFQSQMHGYGATGH
jgi:hypothetical protein